MWPQVHSSLSANSTLCLLLLLALLPARASADSWTAPENSETLSENGAYVFRIIPASHSNKPHPGTCRGMLYARKGDELSLRWERPLLNNTCPIAACVSNSGRYVITMGEWYQFEKLPIVVYGV